MATLLTHPKAFEMRNVSHLKAETKTRIPEAASLGAGWMQPARQPSL